MFSIALLILGGYKKYFLLKFFVLYNREGVDLYNLLYNRESVYL